MQVRDTAEALFIACEMEKRAIRLYERALAVFADGPCQEAIRAILEDERRHLARFKEMGGEASDFVRAPRKKNATPSLVMGNSPPGWRAPPQRRSVRLKWKNQGI